MEEEEDVEEGGKYSGLTAHTTTRPTREDIHLLLWFVHKVIQPSVYDWIIRTLTSSMD